MMAALGWTFIGFMIVPGSIGVAFYISFHPEIVHDLLKFFVAWYVHWLLLEVQA